MLSVVEAQAIVLAHCQPLPAALTELSLAALGRVLAETVVSDIDSPPYAKAMMDGYAVRSADLPEGKGVVQVIEEVTAGRTPTKVLGAGQATRIMTGAPVPDGADAVIPVERTRVLDGERVQIEDRPPRPGLNILPRGQEMRRGEAILLPGTLLRPQVLGLLASLGRTQALVHPVPCVAVLTTGDEVVEAGEPLGPGQIRNSNGPMLAAQIMRAGAVPRALGIACDRLDSLRPMIAQGLQSSILVLSGGVSAGKLDLVPSVLQGLGVQPHFHKVAMKPGKPVFFGTLSTSGTLVFGLPGNPVSSLVCFELFVRPALRHLQGHADPGIELVPVPLAEDFHYATDRPTYHPARVEATDLGWVVRAVRWFGSADLRALAQTNALVLLPAGDHVHRAGERFPVLWSGE